jgi:transposase InsO family protein
MNQLLGKNAIDEIRRSMRDLTGKPAKSMAERMASAHNITLAHVYRLTKDLRKPRKKRADAGKRTFQLVEGTDVWKAAQLVVYDNLDPDQALITIKLRDQDAEVPTLETFRKMLAEKGLGKQARKTGRRSYRQWEAEFPGEIFQVDVTALKTRWLDTKTRRILRIDGVDKNHPQMDPTKLRVWQIMLVDDHSRRLFLRYTVTTHVTSIEMVRFLCEAFGELGVPHKLYTDNGSEFKGQHVRAAKILNKVLENDGGYQHITHAPGNSQASGKVEVAHQWAEKMDRYIGLAHTEGQEIAIDDLNRFAENIIAHNNNNKVHRVTGETPMKRWFGKRVIVRKLPAEIIEDALLSDEFEVKLDASMTVKLKGVFYKIPNEQIFANYIGQKVKIVVPPSIDLILLTLPDGSEWEIEKLVATADKAGEFKSASESTADDLKKRLTKTRKEEIKASKEQKKLTGQIAPVPHFNVEIDQPATNVSHFPHLERVASVGEIAAVTPIVQPPAYDPSIGYWQAVAEFSASFANVDDAKQFLLGIFPNASGEVAKSEVELAIAGRHAPRIGLLKAV